MREQPRKDRRKEADRQKELGIRKDKLDMNEAYHLKIEENEKSADERTAKKRQKRLKKKQNKLKNKAKRSKGEGEPKSDYSSDSSTECDKESTNTKDTS